MILNNQQKNKGSASSSQDGFTIVEAMVAILILTISVSAMLGITASSAASARYANNEITANYLLQEAVDSIRNSRDTLAFQMKDTGGGWDKFLLRYGSPSDKCFSTDNGCILIMEEFDPADIGGSDVEKCNPDTGCPYLDYNEDDKVFYNYSPQFPTPPNSPFKRTVKMKVNTNNPDEVEVTANIKWLNGNETIERTQTLTIYLLNWQK